MANNDKQMTQNPQQITKAVKGPIVKIANGAGTEPVSVPWKEGDTVASVLKRAGVQIKSGRTATIGRRRVRNPEKTEIKAGEVIVIAGQPSNG